MSSVDGRHYNPFRHDTTGDREFRCSTCGARCTRGTDGTEYGHKYKCPHRPDSLPTGSGGSASYYQGGDAA